VCEAIEGEEGIAIVKVTLRAKLTFLLIGPGLYTTTKEGRPERVIFFIMSRIVGEEGVECLA
jgi:hypothetical protein